MNDTENIERPTSTKRERKGARRLPKKKIAIAGLAVLTAASAVFATQQLLDGITRSDERFEALELEKKRTDRGSKFNNVMGGYILARAGVEVLETPANVESGLRNGFDDNKAFTVADGKELPVINPVEINNNGTSYYAFQMTTPEEQRMSPSVDFKATGTVAENTFYIESGKYDKLQLDSTKMMIEERKLFEGSDEFDPTFEVTGSGSFVSGSGEQERLVAYAAEFPAGAIDAVAEFFPKNTVDNTSN